VKPLISRGFCIMQFHFWRFSGFDTHAEDLPGDLNRCARSLITFCVFSRRSILS